MSLYTMYSAVLLWYMGLALVLHEKDVEICAHNVLYYVLQFGHNHTFLHYQKEFQPKAPKLPHRHRRLLHCVDITL